MVEKGCILIFLLITWSTIISSKKATDHLEIWLGCQVLIPCQPLSIVSDSFKWFYMKDEQSTRIQLYFLDKRGMPHYGPGRRVNKTQNRSLILDNFMENDQGVYWCENCYKDICGSGQLNIFSVQKETLKEIQKTFYITAGSNFTQTCPGGFPDLKWTFEASKTTARDSKLRPGTVVETTIYIVNVKSTDAGKYTCWASRCGGPPQKLLTVNLCVIEVHRENSSLSCAMICDEGFNTSKNTSGLLINNATISVDVDPSGSVICNENNILGEASTISYTSSAVLNTTAGNSKETEYMFPVICGVSTVTACFILIALIIFCSKSRLQAFPFYISCCGFNKKEEERSVIYSSVVIKTPPEERNKYTTEAECVYSELKV